MNEFAPDAWALAEESVAACILCAPTETLPLIRPIVQASDFAIEAAGNVFRAACMLADSNKPIDPVTILEQAAESGLSLSADWVRDTLGAYITTANVEYHSKIVRESSVNRKAKDIGWALESGDLAPQDAVDQLQDVLSAKVANLSTPREDANRFMMYLNNVASGETVPYVSTGLENLDDLLDGGLVSSGLITVAARPGIGKTVLGLVIADNVAASGGRVLYESLEMSKEQLWSRRVARMSGVSYSKLMSGTFKTEDEAEWRNIIKAMSALSERQLFISADNARVEDIERHVRQAGHLDRIVIVHMGLIMHDDKSGSMYYPATMTVHALKRLAKATGTPVLMLCQLNRANTQRRDKRATLADLRDTGAIEEDSDAVIFLHREAYYLPPEEQPGSAEPQTMEVNVAKNRHGKTGAVYMDFLGMLANIRPQGGRKTFEETDEDVPFERR